MITGGVVSIAMYTTFGDSTFPALSVELNASVWLESPDTVNGAEYVVCGPPSSEYVVVFTPEPPELSDAVNMTWTEEVYQLLVPAVPESAAVVVGGMVSHVLTGAVPDMVPIMAPPQPSFITPELVKMPPGLF